MCSSTELKTSLKHARMRTHTPTTTVPSHLDYCFILLHDWLCNKIKIKLLQSLLECCKPPFLKAPSILQREMKVLSKEYNSRMTFDMSVNSHAFLPHPRKKKYTLLIAQTVFSRVDPLLVLMIFDKSSRAARRWANVIVDFGDNA